MIDVDSLTGTYGGFADDARPQRRRVEGPTVPAPTDHPGATHPARPRTADMIDVENLSRREATSWRSTTCASWSSPAYAVGELLRRRLTAHPRRVRNSLCRPAVVSRAPHQRRRRGGAGSRGCSGSMSRWRHVLRSSCPAGRRTCGGGGAPILRPWWLRRRPLGGTCSRGCCGPRTNRTSSPRCRSSRVLKPSGTPVRHSSTRYLTPSAPRLSDPAVSCVASTRVASRSATGCTSLTPGKGLRRQPPPLSRPPASAFVASAMSRFTWTGRTSRAVPYRHGWDTSTSRHAIVISKHPPRQARTRSGG